MASIDDGPVLTESRGGILLVTLNRPDYLNAIDDSVSAGVAHALDQLADDPYLRVGVLTGAGRAFCAGADLRALARGESLDSRSTSDRGFGGLVRRKGDKPLIAAVNGGAFGGGLEIVLACDIAIAAETAVFGLPEVRWGLFAGGGAMLRLPSYVPSGIAKRMVLTGESFNADEALRWGLVSATFPSDQLLPEALDLAERVARNAPLAVQASNRMITRSYEGQDAVRFWSENDREFETVLRSDDAQEGMRAFVERRDPTWVNH